MSVVAVIGKGRTLTPFPATRNKIYTWPQRATERPTIYGSDELITFLARSSGFQLPMSGRQRVWASIFRNVADANTKVVRHSPTQP